MIRQIGLCCHLLLHSPDGSPLFVETPIKVVKPIASKHHDHLAGNTHSVIYPSVGSHGFGVRETAPEVIRMEDRCEAQQQQGD